VTTAFPPLALRPPYALSAPSQVSNLACPYAERKGRRTEGRFGMDEWPLYPLFTHAKIADTTNDNETTPTLPAPPHPASTILAT
jgi:hypothetical protein